MPQQQSSTRQRERTDYKEPRHYRVILYNDDFTTMEFVVKMLTTVFQKDIVEAETLMLEVHNKGKAVAGIYTLDIAASKVNKATKMARDEGFPLRLTYEPQE
ncbi:MAG: ATP-dependent Clp protease adaptor ClpS [Prevotella sp.]|nr:ATP-dependent Clp protease adaptor ClpS [Prevotella sp.]